MQIGLALHLHNDTYRIFPVGVVGQFRFQGPEWPYLLHHLLPYLEQDALYQELDIYHRPHPNSGVWPANLKGPISLFQCPNDGANPIHTPVFGVGPYPSPNYLRIFSGLNDGETCSEAFQPGVFNV